MSIHENETCIEQKLCNTGLLYVLKLFTVNCYVNNLETKKEIRAENKRSSENLNKVNVG